MLSGDASLFGSCRDDVDGSGDVGAFGDDSNGGTIEYTPMCLGGGGMALYVFLADPTTRST